MGSFKHQDIGVSWSETKLSIGNRKINRTFDLTMGFPKSVGLRNAKGVELADSGKSDADGSFIGLNRPGYNNSEYQIQSINAKHVETSIFDSEHVEIDVEIFESVQNIKWQRTYFIYPGFPAIAVENSVMTPVTPLMYWSHRRPKANYFNRRFPIDHLESCADSIKLNNKLRVTKTVEFCGRTDEIDQLVVEHKIDSDRLTGNILLAKDVQGDGCLFLQEAPASDERRDFEEYDFRLNGQTVYSCNWGIPPDELRDKIKFNGYRHVIMVFDRECGAELTIKEYLKRRFIMTPDKYAIMVNPWGCGCFSKVISHEFLLDEIAASAECGATHYQIDSDWQAGGGADELSVKNRHMRPEFWKVGKIVNGSFKELSRRSIKNDIELCLWITPSSNCEYRDWEETAKVIWDFHVKDKFKVFKIDAMMNRSYDSDANLRKLFQYLREKSKGKIYFNLDTTNGQRQGYLMFLEYGNIFLENRYACHNGGIGYHPEQTLHNLWQLAKYLRPQSFQIEIASPDDINYKFYSDRNRLAPDAYPIEYWAGIAMFSSPLLWFAPSRMREELRARIKPVMEIHRKIRDTVFAEQIFPIGKCPSGDAITGFYATGGHVIVYREFNAPAEGIIELPEKLAKAKFRLIYSNRGNAEINLEKGNSLRVGLTENASFAVWECRSRKI
jgi:hypothetical protein